MPEPLNESPAISPTEERSETDPTPNRSGILNWLLHRDSSAYAFAVIALSLIKYGAGLYPSWNVSQSFAQHWRDPHSSPLLQGVNDFRLANPVSEVLAAWLHLTGARAFLAFHFVIALVAIAAPFALPAVRRSAELRLTIALLLIGGAIPAVLLNWVGSYDPVTIAAIAVAVLALNPVIAAVGWGLFAFNNSSEAAIAFGVFAIVLFADQRRPALQRLVLAFGGLVAGYVLIQIVLSQWGGATDQFALTSYYGYARLLASVENYWPLIFVTTLGVGWIFLGFRDIRSLLPAQLFAGLAFLGSIVLVFGLDVTRVISTVMWPGMILMAVIVVDRLPRARVHEILQQLLPFALLTVIVVVWDDQLLYAGWSSLIHLLRDVFGSSPIPYAD